MDASLVLVFILETNNQTNNECLPMFFHTDNASSSVKMANNVIIIDIIDHFKLKSWLFHLVLQIANPEQNESLLLNEI